MPYSQKPKNRPAPMGIDRFLGGGNLDTHPPYSPPFAGQGFAEAPRKKTNDGDTTNKGQVAGATKKRSPSGGMTSPAIAGPRKQANAKKPSMGPGRGSAPGSSKHLPSKGMTRHKGA